MTQPSIRLQWVEVSAVLPADSPTPSIAGFAIDDPRVGDRSFGAGVEVNGWIIGADTPVQGVRTRSLGRQGQLYPLDVQRVDVATDYPSFAHAGLSGFTAWLPVDSGAGEWDHTVEAVLASGDAIAFARIAGRTGIAAINLPIGSVPATVPNFLIIGAQRGGTTSLHAALSNHARVHTPKTKELHFFTDRFERGLDWYSGQFSLQLPAGILTGEATPYALFHPLAPERVRRVAPETKLIALLRNPVDRAYSHYLLERSRGLETLDFAAALDAETDRLAGEEAAMLLDPMYVSAPHKHASYVSRGDYAPQLERWFAHFPRDQLLVLRSEDLYQQPAHTLRSIAEFLGIEPEFDEPFSALNRARGPTMEPALRARLSEHFEPRNARLLHLLGWSRGWD